MFSCRPVKLFFNFDQIYLYFWHSLGSAVMRDANLEQFNSLAGARGVKRIRMILILILIQKNNCLKTKNIETKYLFMKLNKAPYSAL